MMFAERIPATVLLFICIAAAAANAEKVSVLQSAADNSTAPASDIIFIVSAAKATFTSPTSLQLANVSSTVQISGVRARTGIISMPYMMNGTLGGPYVNKQGDWLGAPDAVLYGMSAGGQYRAVLVNLNSPKFDPATTTLTFAARVINPNATGGPGLKLTNGSANAVVAERDGGNAAVGLLTAVEPGTAFTEAALFIDSTHEALTPTSGSPLKYFAVGWGGFGAGCFWGGCYISFGR
ncbi:g5856 [Coccomyxa elongata]